MLELVCFNCIKLFLKRLVCVSGRAPYIYTTTLGNYTLKIDSKRVSCRWLYTDEYLFDIVFLLTEINEAKQTAIKKIKRF